MGYYFTWPQVNGVSFRVFAACYLLYLFSFLRREKKQRSGSRGIPYEATVFIRSWSSNRSLSSSESLLKSSIDQNGISAAVIFILSVDDLKRIA